MSFEKPKQLENPAVTRNFLVESIKKSYNFFRRFERVPKGESMYQVLTDEDKKLLAPAYVIARELSNSPKYQGTEQGRKISSAAEALGRTFRDHVVSEMRKESGLHPTIKQVDKRQLAIINEIRDEFGLDKESAQSRRIVARTLQERLDQVYVSITTSTGIDFPRLLEQIMPDGTAPRSIETVLASTVNKLLGAGGTPEGLAIATLFVAAAHVARNRANHS
ncbi:MAG: hypothetical protein WCP97_05730 [bacterium]